MSTMIMLSYRKILQRRVYTFFSTNFALKEGTIFSFTMRSTFTFFFTFQKRKTSKSSILEILPSWYILSLKPKEKGDCKNLIHFSFMSLYIF